MKCWLAFLILSLLNYILAKPNSDGDEYEENDRYAKPDRLNLDYSSGDQDRNPVTLLGSAESGKRPLTSGDTFTPQDMLPIAVKLLHKVKEPGLGKGFVSSTKGPQELADKLFEAFFFSTKRIITLKDLDIAGLDALQALALDGEAVDNAQKTEEVTEAAKRMYLRGQIVRMKNSRPRKSHYKLITRTLPKKESKKRVTKGKRRGIPLAKKLPPKRHLVVNEPPKQKTDRIQKINNKRHKKVTQKMQTINKHMRMTTMQGGKRLKPGRTSPKCRWSYECSNPADLDTCNIHTMCGNNVSMSSGHRKDEDTKAIKEFRRMIGITAVDEEVEKILEARNAKIRPVNLGAINRVESLSEFFNNIIVRENMDHTTPSVSD